jgi:hypothetical protein
MATFWSKDGWRKEPAWPKPDVMDRAIAAGVMFREPRVQDHDGWIRATREAASRLSPLEVGQAFLASLTSRRLDLRSALSSYAVARYLPEHTENYDPAITLGCVICGQFRRCRHGVMVPEDLNVLSFERFKWGGVRRDRVEYVAFDLEQFACAPRLDPTEADLDLGRQLIAHFRHLPASTTAAQAARALTMIPGSKSERDELVDILGVCGVLQTAEYPGYADQFIPALQRKQPSKRFVFGHYPTCWWTAADGVNERALSIFLPDLGE